MESAPNGLIRWTRQTRLDPHSEPSKFLNVAKFFTDLLASRAEQDGQQGRRRIDPRGYPQGFVEDFDESRPPLAACFNILRLSHMRWDLQPQLLQIPPAESRNYRIAYKLNLLPDRNNYESNEMGLEV